MSKSSEIKEPVEVSQSNHNLPSDSSTYDLRLVTKKIKIKYNAYKISNQSIQMTSSESMAISEKGILFHSKSHFEKGSLLRIWVEIPDYWSRKSKFVEYRHTDAPTHFQLLTRVLQSDFVEKGNLIFQYNVLCENLNIDALDVSILQDYLVSTAGVR